MLCHLLVIVKEWTMSGHDVPTVDKQLLNVPYDAMFHEGRVNSGKTLSYLNLNAKVYMKSNYIH